MPTLPFPPDLSIERQHYWIRAHMLFPDLPGTALTFFVRNIVGSELNDLGPDDEIKMMMQFVRALAFGAGVDELVKLVKHRDRAGVTAGFMLVLVFVMSAGKYDRPSLNKAIHIIEEVAMLKRKHNVQFDHYSDRKEILKAWKLMKNGAHFWAALEWIYGPYGSDVLTRVPCGEESIREFLRLSCSFRRFGCNFYESNSREKKTMLDPDSCLQLPDEFESEAHTMSEAPVPQWIQEILHKYRAPKAL